METSTRDGPAESHGKGDSSVPVPPSEGGISADEIALYDRQIRLWGMKAQEKIRNARILLITMKALANEIAKNLVLAGIGSLTVVDHETVTEADLGAQFFLSTEGNHVGMNRAAAASAAIQRLNPRVRVAVDTADIRTKPPAFFADFDIVIATDLDAQTLNVINTATRLNNRAFYAASSHGMYGFIFADLIEHDFVIERTKSNMATSLGPETKTRSIVAVSPKKDSSGGDDPKIELATKRELYSTWLLASDVSKLPDDILKSSRRRKVVTPVLSCLRALWEFTTLYGGVPSSNDHAALAQFTRLCGDKHKALGLPVETLRSEVLRSFLQNIGAEIAPVAAVLGGQLAQDVINVLGQTQQPIQNFVIFDGITLDANMAGMGVPAISNGGIGTFGATMLPPVVPSVDPSQVIALDD
ncbi:hypothetical protein B0T26DRAFT_739709 [Lasiosphaeria miniovina]|uniref:Ubiquitin-like 1-activating enzyme E1A n=1 Tax=Lasiosphaeria miniovina TaxID=1954250 RepID=A0AA40AUY4_9PEZI|nr:uncharacterized protein B0T26DRAFT_739709 [Lasiosphaeria miniovina]KAK0722490.1 hypothetical protein B0T26DRAFT_739709 [Lasiosphaeria miniovina]